MDKLGIDSDIETLGFKRIEVIYTAGKIEKY